MFKLTWINVKSALVSAVITAVIGMGGYIIGLGDIFTVNIHTLVNIGALSALTALVSLFKSLLTTDSGNFIGAVEVK